MNQTTRYPYQLARRIARRLRAERGKSPSEAVLTSLLETLFFASLKSDESRPVLCTVSFVDPGDSGKSDGRPKDRFHVRFDRHFPFDVPTLTKLARAADPAVASLAVYHTRGKQLFVWGMVDLDSRWGDEITGPRTAGHDSAGLFQAAITGPGEVAVYFQDRLVGSLSQNHSHHEYHDILWSGPVHEILASAVAGAACGGRRTAAEIVRRRTELFLRRLNAFCRLLGSIQEHRHGAGLLFVPDATLSDLDIRYRIEYDRLPLALAGLARYEAMHRRLVGRLFGPGQEKRRFQSAEVEAIARRVHAIHERIETHRDQVHSAGRFITSLACVDGVVVLDRRMVVQGFGVEIRSSSCLTDICVAGDAEATPEKRRRAELNHFGTRHRAMMRYCFEHPGSLGFVVSQDGDVRAMTRLGDSLVLWENIDLRLAVQDDSETRAGVDDESSPSMAA